MKSIKIAKGIREQFSQLKEDEKLARLLTIEDTANDAMTAVKLIVEQLERLRERVGVLEIGVLGKEKE